MIESHDYLMKFLASHRTEQLIASASQMNINRCVASSVLRDANIIYEDIGGCAGGGGVGNLTPAVTPHSFN